MIDIYKFKCTHTQTHTHTHKCLYKISLIFFLLNRHQTQKQRLSPKIIPGGDQIFKDIQSAKD